MNYKTVGKPLSQVNYSEKKRKKERDQCYTCTLYAELWKLKGVRDWIKIAINMHLTPPTEFSRSQETYLKNFDLAFKCVIQHWFLEKQIVM